MSIERQHNQMCVMCDGCDDELEMFDRDQFSSMIADAKSKGWSIIPDGEGGYDHRCPSCKPDRVADATRMFGL